MPPIDHANGRPLDALVSGKISKRDVAPMVRRVCGCSDDLLGNLAGVERFCSFLRDPTQRPCKLWVLEAVADGPGAPVLAEVKPAGCGVEVLSPHPGQEKIEPRRDRKAFFRERDCGLEKACPRELAVPAMHLLQQTHEAGHADAQARMYSFIEGNAAPIAQEPVGPSGSRCSFAAVVTLQLLCFGIPVQKESPAADP